MDSAQGVSAGPAPERPPCRHDSMRVDGLFDSCCLRCGADGYWHRGHRHDHTHPSGKLLFDLSCEWEGSSDA